MTMNLTTRERRILEMLVKDSSTSVGQLSKALDVSEVTVRSDLNALASKGFIIRTHGGAVPAFHPNILERQKTMPQEKELIAKKAAELVNDGDNIMISTGTTSSTISKYLIGKGDIHVVTNSTYVLPFARINPSLRVTFIGGEFNSASEGMTGPIAARELNKFRVKTAFVGTDGFSIDGGVSAHSMELADIVRKMSEQSDTTVLVTDSSKYGHTGFAHMLDIEDIDILVTDCGLKSEDREKLEKKSVKIVIAK